MAHDEWKLRRKQNIRETAVQVAKEIRLNNAKGINENLDKQNEPVTVFPEEVVEDAAMIEEYIKTGQKVYKD